MSEKIDSNVAENFKTQKSEQYYVDIVSGLAERTIKRLWIVILLLIVLLVGTNVAWIVYESQFEETTVTQEVETGEGDAYVAGVGYVNYGESQADSQNTP